MISSMALTIMLTTTSPMMATTTFYNDDLTQDVDDNINSANPRQNLTPEHDTPSRVKSSVTGRSAKAEAHPHTHPQTRTPTHPPRQLYRRRHTRLFVLANRWMMSNSIERVTHLDPSIRARISRLQNIEVRGIDSRGVGAFIRRARVESRPVVCRGNLCNRRYTGLIGCCGADGPMDYVNLNRALPTECRDTVTGNAFFHGCVDEVTWYLEEKSEWITGIAVFLSTMHLTAVQTKSPTPLHPRKPTDRPIVPHRQYVQTMYIYVIVLGIISSSATLATPHSGTYQ
ncbi:unnamed protein product [Bemisia tabaci]|uniref:Uncharacterized protein n=1 Tax=Bemisia tabaci TaxID=7038 RepID=A0A9P0F752_BEMTA|nr:unnamed protein product [Bemisia tabaci]